MEGGDSADLDTLRERLDLGARVTKRGSLGIALLAVEVHRPVETGGGEAPDDGEIEAEVRRRVAGCVRRVDTIARTGPYRMLVLLERIDDGPFAAHVADAIVEAVREPIRRGGDVELLVASVGIAMHPDDGDDVEALVRSAEAAVQGARAAGGDLFGFSSRRMGEEASRRLAVERALVGVIERGELSLHFQPQLDARDGTVVGVEALLRWRNAKLGPVGPDEFIPILEANGQIDRVGAWVLEQACRYGASWQEHGKPLRVGVNVSAHQLRDPAFAAVVERAVESSGLPPSLLELELTEGVLVDNPESTRQMLDGLRRRGVRIAVDDFGTGYASLAYVRQFPMDTIKIDRQFVRGLPLDNECAAITSAIIALGKSLRLEVVAEGVETEAAEEFVFSQRCYIMQGYRHARPMPADELSEWRRRRPWA